MLGIVPLAKEVHQKLDQVEIAGFFGGEDRFTVSILEISSERDGA